MRTRNRDLSVANLRSHPGAAETPDIKKLPGIPLVWKRGVLVAVILAIAVATLRPIFDVSFAPPVACLLCGTRGVSDFILNIALFFPLGVALAWLGMPLRRALLTGLIGSGLIEVAQMALPGRDSSLGDVISNSVGCALGALGVTRAALVLEWTWRHPPVIPVGWGGLTATIAVATGWLLAPTFPESTYFGQWTPDLGHLEWYRGRVTGATVGSHPVPEGRIPDGERVRSLLTDGRPIDVRGVAGPPTTKLGSLFSIYDDRQREIVLIGPDRDDLAFRYRTRATVFNLDQPDYRGWGLLSDLTVGDSIRVRVSGTPLGSCLEINAVRVCGLNLTVGSGWSLLMYPERASRAVRWLLNLAWLAGLTAPIGLFAHRRRELMAAGTLVGAGLAGAPLVTVLGHTPLTEWAAAGLGVLIGLGARSFWITDGAPGTNAGKRRSAQDNPV